MNPWTQHGQLFEERVEEACAADPWLKDHPVSSTGAAASSPVARIAGTSSSSTRWTRPMRMRQAGQRRADGAPLRQRPAALQRRRYSLGPPWPRRSALRALAAGASAASEVGEIARTLVLLILRTRGAREAFGR